MIIEQIVFILLGLLIVLMSLGAMAVWVAIWFVLSDGEDWGLAVVISPFVLALAVATGLGMYYDVHPEAVEGSAVEVYECT